MIVFKHSGSFKHTDSLLERITKMDLRRTLNKYGAIGVQALASATPKDSGITASSWGYEIRVSRSGSKIMWTNSSINDGIPIVILLQYGHGTRNGGYVQGIDFINPAMKDVFNKIANDVWTEVTGR